MTTDMSKIRKEFIPIADVPAPHTRITEWDEIFSSIPKGQALVLHEPEVYAGTVRGALTRKQKDGKFKNLQFSSKGKHGSAIVYVSNMEKLTEKQADKPMQKWTKPVT